MTTSLSNAPAAAPPARADDGDALARPDGHAAPEVAAPPRPATLAGRGVVLVLCLAVVLSTLAFGTVHLWAIAVFATGAALVALLWALDSWRTRTLRFSKNVLQLPLAGLFVVGLVQLLPLGAGGDAAGALSVEPARSYSLDPQATRFALVQIGALIVYFAAALAYVDSPKRLRLFVRLVVLFGALLALYSLLQYFLNPTQIYWVRQPRYATPFGPFINRHHFAGYMELTIGLPVGMLLAGAVKKELMPLYIFGALMMTVALVATGSRGGLLALTVEVVFLVAAAALARGRRKSRVEEGAKDGGRRRTLARVGLQLAAALVLVVGALAYAGEGLLSHTLSAIASDNITTDRTKFWQGTREIIREYPWLGTGLGAFGVAFTRHDPLGGSVRLEQAHNEYLQILSDAGVVGGALGLVFLVALFRGGFARMASVDRFRRGVALGALGGCVGALTHSLVDFPLRMTSTALLFLLLAALATLNGRVEQVEEKKRRRRRKGSSRSIVGDERPARAGSEEHAAAAGATRATP